MEEKTTQAKKADDVSSSGASDDILLDNAIRQGGGAPRDVSSAASESSNAIRQGGGATQDVSSSASESLGVSAGRKQGHKEMLEQSARSNSNTIRQRSQDRPEDTTHFEMTPGNRKSRPLGHGSAASYDSLNRPVDQTGAMPHWTRVRKKLKHLVVPISGGAGRPSSQYRIPPREEAKPWYMLPLSFVESSMKGFSLWCHRSSFVYVLTVFLLVYYLLISCFMLIIYGIMLGYSRYGRVCVDELSFEHGVVGFSPASLELAFELSWTTFSTVGYGVIAPTTETGCTLLRFTCAMEAFFGVLYASFCGAIIYSKVTRLHAHALVTFSSPLCLTFDTGVREAPLDSRRDLLSTKVLFSPSEGMKEEDEFLDAKEDTSLPYPVLEFRIVNNRSKSNSIRDDRDLIGASISCMLAVHQPFDQDKSQGPGEAISHEFFYNVNKPRRDKLSPRRASTRNILAVDHRVPIVQRSFYPIKFQPDKLPLFTRVWYARHVLDASSPLLRSEVRKYIEMHGHWPKSINDYASIRQEALIEFEKIIVTLNATSKVSADGVFAKKVYKYDDIYIGWQFAGVLFVPSYNREEEYSDDYDFFQDVQVDINLAHDILPQDGGGQEPLGGLDSTHRVAAENRLVATENRLSQ